jgi:ribosome-associated translation inhibitor RaiA
MLIQLNADRNITLDEGLNQRAKEIITSAMERYTEHVTRVEAHLSDQNSDKKSSGAEMRCLLEARLAGMQPIAASDQAETLDQAISGAATNLVNAIETVRGRRAAS